MPGKIWYANLSTLVLCEEDTAKYINFEQIISYMLVERTTKEIIIRLPVSIDTEDLQDLLNFARYKELTSSFKVDQKEVDKLANQINTQWWTKNRNKLVK